MAKGWNHGESAVKQGYEGVWVGRGGGGRSDSKNGIGEEEATSSKRDDPVRDSNRITGGEGPNCGNKRLYHLQTKNSVGHSTFGRGGEKKAAACKKYLLWAGEKAPIKKSKGG